MTIWDRCVYGIQQQFNNIQIIVFTASQGLTTSELEDILSCDEEVLHDVFQYWTPPIRRLPPLLWVRIRADLASYLVDRGADGTQLICWYHRQFVEAAVDRYLSDPIEKKSRHSAIADYFLGRNFVGERKLRYFLLISYPDRLSTKLKARSGQVSLIFF